MIKLYHFCCDRDMPGIRSQGITKGMICGEQLIEQTGKYQNFMIPGWQWLTYDGGRARQSWATQKIIHYSRLEYRFAVGLPEADADQLYDRDRLKEIYPGTEKLFDGWDGSEFWVVYRGSISKYCLKKLEHWNKETGTWEEVPLRRDA